MIQEELVDAHTFCLHHKIEISFIHSLQENGLIETIVAEESLFIPLTQLPQLEKLVRLYYEMDINLEGIETINYLLHRMGEMQDQLTVLKNRLALYE